MKCPPSTLGPLMSIGIQRGRSKQCHPHCFHFKVHLDTDLDVARWKELWTSFFTPCFSFAGAPMTVRNAPIYSGEYQGDKLYTISDDGVFLRFWEKENPYINILGKDVLRIADATKMELDKCNRLLQYAETSSLRNHMEFDKHLNFWTLKIYRFTQQEHQEIQSSVERMVRQELHRQESFQSPTLT